MKDNFKEKPFALFIRKSSFVLDSDNDKSDSEEEYIVELYSSAAMVMKHCEKFDNKKFGGTRRFPEKSSLLASKRSDGGNSRKDEGKCFNCGDVDHFAHDCKVKKNNLKEESYETKYKRLVASLTRQNVEPKILVAEGEKWLDEE